MPSSSDLTMTLQFSQGTQQVLLYFKFKPPDSAIRLGLGGRDRRRDS